MIHIYDEGDCVFVEMELDALYILEGSGITLADALRDLAIEIEDMERELGYEIEAIGNVW